MFIHLTRADCVGLLPQIIRGSFFVLDNLSRHFRCDIQSNDYRRFFNFLSACSLDFLNSSYSKLRDGTLVIMLRVDERWETSCQVDIVHFPILVTQLRGRQFRFLFPAPGHARNFSQRWIRMDQISLSRDISRDLRSSAGQESWKRRGRIIPCPSLAGAAADYLSAFCPRSRVIWEQDSAYSRQRIAVNGRWQKYLRVHSDETQK